MLLWEINYLLLFIIPIIDQKQIPSFVRSHDCVTNLPIGESNVKNF